MTTVTATLLPGLLLVKRFLEAVMLKIARKTQQMIFESEVLPSLFHSTTEKLFHYLERDSSKFLHFYWHEAGEKIDPSLKNEAF